MRHFIFTCLLALFSLPAFAQLDAKVNLGSLITGGINVAGDIGLSDNTSVSIGLGRAVTKFSINENEYRLARWRFVPEFRYYFSPEYGADHFFAGAYGRLASVKGEDITDQEDVDAIRGALGVLLGYKWVGASGFVFELNGGLGRGATFGDGDNNEAVNTGLSFLGGIDIRLGIIAGYRFGG